MKLFQLQETMFEQNRIYFTANFMLLLFSSACWGHNLEGYSHDDTIDLNSESENFLSNWMKNIPGSRRLSQVSIPGTHDTMARYGGDSVQTQSMTLENQLKSGIRVLDIRCRHIGNKCAIHHGPIYQNANYDDVLNTVSAFLKSHPTETVIMRVKDGEHTNSDNTRSFSETFQDYVNGRKGLFWNSSSDNPTLDEVRGKIVVLQNFGGRRFGIPYGSLVTQDQYEMGNNWDLYDKWEKVKEHIIEANGDNRQQIYLNYLSASVGSFPYFVASGHSSPETNGCRLATNLSTPEWSDSYPDFPRTDCLNGVCTIAFEGTNILTSNYLKNDDLKYVGIIMADFPGSGVINKVIHTNDRF